jgi:nicotinamidase/pyrazinamidase
MTAQPIQSDDALIVVDVQRDFCPGGALPIPGGDEVVPVLNRWIEAFQARGGRVIFSRDWHPHDHRSFTDYGGPWPRHCVQYTAGAEFHPGLSVPRGAQVVSKGSHTGQDQYSALAGTGLAEQLRGQGVHRLWIAGLAQDVCVRETVLDACRAGFQVHVIANATRPVDAQAGKHALDQMRAAGAVIELRELDASDDQ